MKRENGFDLMKKKNGSRPESSLVIQAAANSLERSDLDFVKVSEELRDDALLLLKAEPTIEALLDDKNRVQTLGEFLTRKIKARDAKLEAQNNIAEVRIRYEREIGKLIRAMQDRGELATKGKSTSMVDLLKLEDINVSHNQSSRWQAIALLPDDKFEAQISDAKENGWELTTAAFVAHGKNHSNPGGSGNGSESSQKPLIFTGEVQIVRRQVITALSALSASETVTIELRKGENDHGTK